MRWKRGGYLQSGGEEKCPSLGHLAGHGRERKRALMVGVGGSEWRGKIGIRIGILENGKACGCGGRKGK